MNCSNLINHKTFAEFAAAQSTNNNESISYTHALILKLPREIQDSLWKVNLFLQNHLNSFTFFGCVLGGTICCFSAVPLTSVAFLTAGGLIVVKVIKMFEVQPKKDDLTWLVLAGIAASFALNWPLCLILSGSLIFLRTSKIHKKGNATALEFVSLINATLFIELTKLSERESQEFLNRGGSLNIITTEKIKEKRIALHKEEQVITGCNSGINRSQVAAVVIKKMGITVAGVLAGGDSAMNPEADFSSFADPLEMGEEKYKSATNFKECFDIDKFVQIGAKELGNFRKGEKVKEAKKFFQDFIDQLSHTHFITFGPSGLSVLRRLLQRKGSLEGFTITHFPWNDEIAHPPKDCKFQPYSKKSYKHFAKKVSLCFTTVQI
jgi:hypothetical protein